MFDEAKHAHARPFVSNKLSIQIRFQDREILLSGLGSKETLPKVVSGLSEVRLDISEILVHCKSGIEWCRAEILCLTDCIHGWLVSSLEHCGHRICVEVDNLLPHPRFQSDSRWRASYYFRRSYRSCQVGVIHEARCFVAAVYADHENH